ncbi:hypothetical protein BD289DRAFT_441164 [Coniella lustricola]|uniref:Uncharacterized protein n=1 Tax=Coniella lustricola TaxID=2025994 RepID=A0A2T2ZZT1_9PEZI|nr:hypothetical protein BD289DRAFT_441164 [Coniella lustricola]
MEFSDPNLLQAASTGDVQHLEQLLATYQPSEWLEATVQNLLITGSWECQLQVIQFLFNKYKPNVIPEEAIRAAIYSGSIPLFSEFLLRDPSIINLRLDRRSTPLVVACIARKPIEFLRYLLEQGADPNRGPEDSMPLPIECIGTFYQDPAAVDLLMQYGAVLSKDSNALESAERRGNTQVLNRLRTYYTTATSGETVSARVYG